MGPTGRKPALGGVSLAVATQADEAERAAGRLFIRWAISKANTETCLRQGGVPARVGAAAAGRGAANAALTDPGPVEETVSPDDRRADVLGARRALWDTLRP